MKSPRRFTSAALAVLVLLGGLTVAGAGPAAAALNTDCGYTAALPTKANPTTVNFSAEIRCGGYTTATSIVATLYRGSTKIQSASNAAPNGSPSLTAYGSGSCLRSSTNTYKTEVKATDSSGGSATKWGPSNSITC